MDVSLGQPVDRRCTWKPDCRPAGHPAGRAVRGAGGLAQLGSADACAPVAQVEARHVAHVMTHKYRRSIIVLSISKSVEPNEEQKEMISGFQQGILCKY